MSRVRLPIYCSERPKTVSFVKSICFFLKKVNTMIIPEADLIKPIRTPNEPPEGNES